MGKRQLKDWPRRINDQINATSGILGLGSAGIAGTGIFLAVPAVTALGAALVGTVVVVCLIRSFPERMRHPEEFLGGKIHELRLIDTIDPPPVRIGFLGASGAGKSTAVAHLGASPTPENVRTDNPYASIIVLPAGPVKYICFIDAAGQKYSQQFRVLDESEHVFVFLDHASNGQETEIQKDRIAEHENFLEQIHGHFRDHNTRLKGIHFILNKRDTWEQGSHPNELAHWFDGIVNRWSVIPTISVSSAFHSNFITSDNSKFIAMLRKLA